MKTNWRDFGIGMASGIAFCFVLYFAWGLIHPHRPEPVNSIATANTSVGMDENALIAANAERQNNNNMTPPPVLQPEPQRNEVRNEPLLAPEPRPEPPVTRPRPRPEPDDDIPPPPDEPGLDDDDGGKPNY